MSSVVTVSKESRLGAVAEVIHAVDEDDEDDEEMPSIDMGSDSDWAFIVGKIVNTPLRGYSSV
jgi:hypothetical protein